jgi:hypothetical protein
MHFVFKDIAVALEIPRRVVLADRARVVAILDLGR